MCGKYIQIVFERIIVSSSGLNLPSSPVFPNPNLRVSSHLPLLFLPGRIQKQVPIPIVLLLHVAELLPRLLCRIIRCVVVYHLSTNVRWTDWKRLAVAPSLIQNQNGVELQPLDGRSHSNFMNSIIKGRGRWPLDRVPKLNRGSSGSSTVWFFFLNRNLSYTQPPSTI